MQTQLCPDDEVLSAWAKGSSEVAALVREHIASCSACRTVVAELARTTGARPARALGRYELKEEVGSGGMGTVYAAWDPVVQRKVALKVLHEANAGGDSQRAQRFLLERQVLAGLVHPNIARLLDAGETEDGRPWFAMDFIDGQPIDAWCDRRGLGTRQRLELLLPVFASVSAAHQRLVVHRDLKPGNILVDVEGQPRLVDFGIARLLEGSTSLTRTGVTPMTPAYASPEQVRREPASVTSDVYSLGVVMYELLTGVSPYTSPPGDVEALLRAIATEEVKPPSAGLARSSDAMVACRGASRAVLRDELSEEFDAIVLMALRKEVGDRYPTVDALADDVRAALDGLPTRAKRGDRAYRAARFVRRRKALVAGVAAGFVALVIGLVATLWQAHRAEQERDLARARFEQVRSLAHAVLFDYSDGIAELPGSTPLRERLVKDASSYLNGLSAEARDDVGLRTELAAAFLKLGDLQGDPFSASLGDTTAAKSSYLEGRALAQSVLAELPNDVAARHALAQSHEKEGAILEVTGQLDGALEAYDLALALDQKLLDEAPDDLDQRLQVSRDELAAGQVLLAQGESDAAGVRLERSLTYRRAVLERRDDTRSRRAVAVVLNSLCMLRSSQGRKDEAIAAGEEAARIFEALLAQQPDSFASRRALSTVWEALSALYRLAGQSKEAVAVLEKAVVLNRQTLAADPQNASAQRDLVVALGNMMLALNGDSAWARAKAIEAEVLPLQRKLREADPDNLQTVTDLVYVLTTGARTCIELGDAAGAEERLAEVERLVAESGTDGEATSLAEEGLGAHAYRAELRERQGRFEEAIRENQLTIDGFEEILKTHPDLKRLESRLAILLENSARFGIKRAEKLRGDEATRAWTEACQVLDRAVARFTALNEENKQTGTTDGPQVEAKELQARCAKALATPR